jgi:aldose 1-epimerase
MQYVFRTSRKLLAVLGAAALALLVAVALSGGSSASAQAGNHSSGKPHHRDGTHHGKGRGHKSHPGGHKSHPGGHKSHPGGRCASIDGGTKWGTLNNAQDPLSGKSVDLYTLTSGHRMTVRISNYGGIVESMWVPNRAGKQVNVALGFAPTQTGLLQYETMFINPPTGGSGNTYFGAIIGRYANRIANAEFSLNGKTYHLPANNGPNTLHGGPDAYNAQIWDATTSTDGCKSASLTLKYTDPDGKNGFPAAVDNEVTYTLTNENKLEIHYAATNTDKSLATVINLTNHTYFNLAGEGSGDIYRQLLAINANKYTPTNSNLIPTGQFADVAGTPFDFRTMKPIGRDIRDANVNDNSTGWTPTNGQLTIAHGYDHNWVLNPGSRLAAVAQEPKNGITLWTYTDQPGVQMYSGNFLVGDLVGTSGRTYRQSDGFTLETQHYPDAPHHQGDPNWPSVVLKAGDTFQSTTTYGFTTAGRGLRHRFHF